MKLTSEEQSILEGRQGRSRQKAMEILLALGNIYQAEKLIKVASVQVAGISYKNLGDAGLEFLTEWAGEGARVVVPTTLNPAGMDLQYWSDLGFSEEFARKQLQVIECYRQFGIAPVCCCTPYLIGQLPLFGQHIAWAESSAVSFANSVLGARSNREGGPSALAAAIIGKTAGYGLHLSHNRRANFLVEVQCQLTNEADYGALGYLIGREIGAAIPLFRGISDANIDQLKALGAAMAASGAVALYHIDELTPEACQQNILSESHQTMVIEELDQAYQSLNDQVEAIDLVAIGCPHASLSEIAMAAEMVAGKKIKSQLWITTAISIYAVAKRAGYLATIEAAGGHVVSDTCVIVAPIAELGVRSLATNSAKAACYAPHHCRVKVRYADFTRCIQAAINGRMPL